MAVSAASVESIKPKFKKYKIVNRTDVDESLFGPPARLKQMTGNRSWTDTTVPDTSSKEKSKSGEKMLLITKDLIRKLKVPSTPDPSGKTVVLENSEYDRIVKNAKFLTPQERKQLEEERKAEQNARMEASNDRKKMMQELELIRKKNEKPSDLEQESIEKGAELLSKATSMLEEQDDEIKKLNELILNAKCHAIRDAQLREKEDMGVSMAEEEARLDKMMEIERLKAVEDYDKQMKKIRIQRLKGAEVIQEQINEREQQRLLDVEKKDQETQAMLAYLERLQEEDLENLQKKKASQKTLMEEVAKFNTEIQRQKQQKREQMKMEELRVLDYIKEKDRIESEQQAELKKQKAEKEREIARLRAQQERAKDKQAEKDTLRAKRRQEEFERAARKKEKEEAEKKLSTERMLIAARQDQIQQKEHFLAVQAMQDRNEFERVLKVQQDLAKQDKEKAERLATHRHAHALEVRQQVKEKEEEKVKARKQFFEEGVRLDQEAKERRKRLDEIKQRKLEELKAAGVPDIYCAEVSRRITAPPASFTMSKI